MAQSFADWQQQLAIQSIMGGILGQPMSQEAASSPQYSNTVNQLVGKMGDQSSLSSAFKQGLTPQQILYGNSGTPTFAASTAQGGTTGGEGGASSGGAPTPAMTLSAPFYNSNLYNDPSKVGYDPNRGLTNYSGEKQSTFNKIGDYMPLAIMAAMSMGMGGAIGAVGGAGAGLGTGFGGGQSIFNAITKTLFNADSGGLPSSGGSASGASSGDTQALLPIILALLKGGG